MATVVVLTLVHQHVQMGPYALVHSGFASQEKMAVVDALTLVGQHVQMGPYALVH
jgi:hydrogenase maturation factor